MGKRGPKPMSGEQLQVRGSRLAAQRLLEEEAARERAAALEEATIIYDEAVLQLRATGTPFADRMTLARYAGVLVQYIKDAVFVAQYGSCQTTKNRQGQIVIKVFPQYKAMLAASAELSRLEKVLGLSAEGRAALGVTLELRQKHTKPKSSAEKYFERQGL